MDQQTISDLDEITLDHLAEDQAAELRTSGEDTTTVHAYDFSYADQQRGTAIYFAASCRMGVMFGGNSIWGDCFASPSDLDAIAVAIEGSANDPEWAD